MNVMIDRDLFLKMVRYFFFDDEDQLEDIRFGLMDKVNKMAAREQYTAVLNASSDDEAREALQRYIDNKYK